jgi:hypothetical protein
MPFCSIVIKVQICDCYVHEGEDSVWGPIKADTTVGPRGVNLIVPAKYKPPKAKPEPTIPHTSILNYDFKSSSKAQRPFPFPFL